MLLTEDQRVRIRAVGIDGDWCEGRIALASANGRSVAVVLAGALMIPGGVIAGVLPLIIDPEKETVTGLAGEEYELEYQPTSRPAS